MVIFNSYVSHYQRVNPNFFMFHVIPIHPRPARILAISARARLLLAIHHAANFVKVLRRDHPKLPQPQVVPH
jgi:hypothetical protein